MKLLVTIAAIGYLVAFFGILADERWHPHGQRVAFVGMAAFLLALIAIALRILLGAVWGV